MARFVTADTHFGHGGALGLFGRKHEGVAAMDAALIEAWNATVGADDEVWHLGDFAVRPKPGRVDALLAALAGTKHLIVGNNDAPATCAAVGWASVANYVELEVADGRAILCHYPFRSWRDMGRGSWNLHGHSHGKLAPLPRQRDVGVDAVGYAPLPLEAALAPSRRKAEG